MRTSWLPAVFFLVSCGGALAEPVPWLDVPTEPVASVASLGSSHTVVVDVRNSGTASGSFTARVDPPFEISDARYDIAPGATVGVSVFVTPDDTSTLRGDLELTLGADQWTVPLEVVVQADDDGDGFVDRAAGGDDCDDDDAQRFPGAPERCNGLDDDCDDEVDEGLDTISQWPDVDGDDAGDASATPVEDCALRVGFADNTDDCDDDDPDAFVGADEVWYDGRDQACDGGSDYDRDGDGVDRLPEGDDCDDQEPTVAPGLDELADGLDNDCDGLRDEDTVAAGELVITELFAQPDRSVARWLEVHNPGATTVDLALVELEVDGSPLPLPSGLLEPGALVLWCSEDDDGDNGGLACDAQVALPQDAEVFVLLGPEGTVDAVDTTGWTRTVGRSLELSLGDTDDAEANDDEAAWCIGVSLFGDDSGDRGTPGALLPPC